jgi:hypothetical protein
LGWLGVVIGSEIMKKANSSSAALLS